MTLSLCMFRRVGSSLALCPSPVESVPASPISYSPDSPSCVSVYLPQAPAGDCSHQRDSERYSPLLVSLVTNEPT